jgi:hypothetical protein
MSIQPLTPSSSPREISVTDVIEPAYERVKQMLFRPFNLSKWITIGFCAWLAGLGETGGGGGGFNGFNGGGSNHHGNRGQGLEEFRHFYQQAQDYFLLNIGWIVPLAAIVVLLSLALWLAVLWLSCRGKFMFLHCVALDKAEVEVPWKKFAGAANSLFWFRLWVGLAGMVLMLPMLVFSAVLVVKMLLRGEPNLPAVLLTAGLAMAFLLFALGFGVIHKFLVDFVVPIMFLRGGSCLAAWGEFYALLSAHFWQFVVYLLFQIVVNMVLGMMILLAILVTCCIAGCVMLLPFVGTVLLPFVGTVLLLPVLVFQRSYPLYYLAQFGPRYEVFSAPEAPPVAGI